MFALLRTYLDVILLRRGPDAVPRSWLVLAISVGILLAGWWAQLTLSGASADTFFPVLVAYLVALAFYATIVTLLGFRQRLLQMMSTIIACGALLALTSAAVALLLSAMLSPELGNSIAALIWFWSVPVKGHILAVTVNRHWFFGIGVAMLAYVMRFAIETSLFMRGATDVT